MNVKPLKELLKRRRKNYFYKTKVKKPSYMFITKKQKP